MNDNKAKSDAAPKLDNYVIDPDQNSEQDETGTQAQDVAHDALENPASLRGEGVETEHGGTTNPAQITPDDVEDVVDKMNAMNRSGRIDMGAFDGEDNLDDEDGSVPDYGGEKLPE
jgi:hypothetical protein